MGNGGTLWSLNPAMATSEAFRRGPSRVLRSAYTIGLEATTLRKECLFNIEHWLNEDADAGRGAGIEIADRDAGDILSAASEQQGRGFANEKVQDENARQQGHTQESFFVVLRADAPSGSDRDVRDGCGGGGAESE